MKENLQHEAKSAILHLVAEYYGLYHKKQYKHGDRISYASRVYDDEELTNLVDATWNFWLTAGRYTDEFEHQLAAYLGVKYCSLVNSGSSANLLAFMALTSPLLRERQVQRGDEMITVAAGFPTTVAPAVQFGEVPFFCRCVNTQYKEDVQLLEEELSEEPNSSCQLIRWTKTFDLKQVNAFR